MADAILPEAIEKALRPLVPCDERCPATNKDDGDRCLGCDLRRAIAAALLLKEADGAVAGHAWNEEQLEEHVRWLRDHAAALEAGGK